MSKSSRQKLWTVLSEETWQTAAQLADKANIDVNDAKKVLYNLQRQDKLECRRRDKKASQWIKAKGASIDVQRYTHASVEKFDVTASVDLAHAMGY